MKDSNILNKKFISLLILIIIYGLTFFEMYLVVDILDINILLSLLIADVVGTILIFIFSNIFSNSSCYDPYWSIIPPYLIFLYINKTGININIQSIIILVIVGLWSIRLTINWLITFKNLKTEDFRYIIYRNKKGFFFSNLFGIHLVPTILVYVSLLPVFFYLKECINVNINVSTIISIIIGLVGIIIELISDIQLKKFIKNRTDNTEICNIGLWKTSRHPNYLGEIMFWWSLYMMSLSINEGSFILILGPILMILLFYFISVPLIEKRLLSNRTKYQEYINNTNMFLIFPKKK